MYSKQKNARYVFVKNKHYINYFLIKINLSFLNEKQKIMTEFFTKSAENYFIIFAHKFADFFFRKNQKVRNFFVKKISILNNNFKFIMFS